MKTWYMCSARKLAWAQLHEAFQAGCMCALCKRYSQHLAGELGPEMMEGYIAFYSTTRMHQGISVSAPPTRRARPDAAGDQGPILPADRSPA